MHLYAAFCRLGQPQPRLRLPGGRLQRAAEGLDGPPTARGALGPARTAPEALAAWRLGPRPPSPGGPTSRRRPGPHPVALAPGHVHRRPKPRGAALLGRGRHGCERRAAVGHGHAGRAGYRDVPPRLLRTRLSPLAVGSGAVKRRYDSKISCF